MLRILLFSDNEEVFEVTNSITTGWIELIKCDYKQLKENSYPFADIVIMHFDKEKIKEGTFELIIKVKGRLGHKIPILAIIEGGTRQEIFSVLCTGVDDYIEDIKEIQEYRKKIEQIVLWDWYQKKYGIKKEE